MKDVKVRLEGAPQEVPRHTGDALWDVLHPVAEARLTVEDGPVGTLVEEELVLTLDGRLQAPNEGSAAVRIPEEATLRADELAGAASR